MSDERHETVADNVSANHQFREVAKMIPHEEVAVSKMETTTPTGNAAEMREALLEASIALSDATHHHLTENDAKECLAVVEAALSAPPRNCDVGTPKEQSARFDAHCRKHTGCLTCPLREKDGGVPKHCELAWSQMPYEHGDTK